MLGGKVRALGSWGYEVVVGCAWMREALKGSEYASRASREPYRLSYCGIKGVSVAGVLGVI